MDVVNEEVNASFDADDDRYDNGDRLGKSTSKLPGSSSVSSVRGGGGTASTSTVISDKDVSIVPVGESDSSLLSRSLTILDI